MTEGTPITIETIWERLNQNQNELLLRLNGLETQMTQMNGAMNALNEQIAEMQIRVSAAEDNLGSTDKKVKDMIKRVQFLEEKVDYMENKSRQNNVIIYGIAEREEKKDTVAFVQRFLVETLGLSPDFASHTEMAHRISAKAPIGKRPRPIIAKFGSYQHKARVMKLAREKKTLLYKDAKVSIYSDVSATVQRKRQLFAPVKKKLYAAGIRYAMLFPAILSVDYMGMRKRFETHLEAEEFVNSLDISSAPPSPMT